MKKRKKQPPKKAPPATRTAEVRAPDSAMSPEYRSLITSRHFHGWSSQDALFMDWGRWKGERPKEVKTQ